MKIKEKKFIKLIIIATTAMIVSCVGTIKDKNAQQSNVVTNGTFDSSIQFNGLLKVNPIAGDKVELFFSPASGPTNDYVYEIYVNGSPISTKLSGSSLPLNTNNVYSTVISNLSLNTTYTFNIKAIATGTGSTTILDPLKAQSTTTFSNATADFQGISGLVLNAGIAGETSAIISWLPATTKGTGSVARPTDPVAYEITYISQLGGLINLNNPNYTGSDRKIITVPDELNNLSTNPVISNLNSYTIPINQLNPGTIYYFQVRAIHKNYVLYKSDASYKRELNTRYKMIKTLNSTGAFDFKTNSISLTSPVSDLGLTTLNFAWLPASGPFDSYQVCYKKVTNATTDRTTASLIVDNIIYNDGVAVSSDGGRGIVCLKKDPSETYQALTSLDTYAYYQVKVFACKNSSCSDHLGSTTLQKRVETNIAPFGGILSFTNPESISAINTIKINFDPPVTTAGYLNEFHLYCYNGPTDTTPIDITNLSFPTSGLSKSICNGITISSSFYNSIDNPSFPSNFSDFSSFSQISLELPAAGFDGNHNYCFSLVPSINSESIVSGSNANILDTSHAVVKCFFPQILTPTIAQFQGRDINCTPVNNGKDLQISWGLPTGGLYSNFVTFAQEKKTTNVNNIFFNFNTAEGEYLASPNIYKAYTASNTAITQTLTGLTPGKTYNIGVIPYLASENKWGQENYSVGECTVPLPKATFQEWTQIFAIGPKENGLVPAKITGRSFILETIDDAHGTAEGTPVEIKTSGIGVSIAPDTSDSLAATKIGTVLFDGIYGRVDSNSSASLHQYSNSGIVKLMWKDVKIYGTEPLYNYTNAAPESTALKSAKQHGYKVYRSDDNKLSWIELTKYSATKNTNQLIANNGLVVSKSYSTFRTRNNVTPTGTIQVATFTDYSVKFSGNDGDTDKGRIYYYKIVPVFYNNEIVYDDLQNPNHNIIKVILPPRNMALVNRMMANKTICREMNKSISYVVGDYYSCVYNGVGSKSLDPTSLIDNMKYDLGGDLLIDRFELGVPFTRGDPSTSASNSKSTQTMLSFDGIADNGFKFAGCFNNKTSNNEQGTGTPLTASPTYSYNNLIPGDCIGNDNAIFASAMKSTCADPSAALSQRFIYPGANGTNILNSAHDCTEAAYAGKYLTNLANNDALPLTDLDYAPTQSEFGAVYYIRNAQTDYLTATLFNLPGGNNTYIKQNGYQQLNNSYMNIPYVDSSGKLHPRWIPTNRMFGGLSVDTTDTAGYLSSASFTLYDKTINQVLSMSQLFDSVDVLTPAANLVNSLLYTNSSTVLGRLFSSNAAKLPPLLGIPQKNFHQLCSTYKVKVGYEYNSTFTNAFSSVFSKRLMRKKESTVAAAWPSEWDDTTILSIEKGTDAPKKGCNGLNKTGRPTASNPLQMNSIFNNYYTIDGPNGYKPFTITGSSGTDSTENCVSKFGVQDLAGNVSEHNSDTLYCNYLNPDNSIIKPVAYYGNGNDYSSGAPLNDGISYDLSGSFHFLVKGNSESGNCSANEYGVSNTTQYIDINSSFFKSIFETDSNTNLNSDIVKASKGLSFDAQSILASRNGDGSFLNFGQTNMGPSLQFKDAFINKPNLYFNPALGIPLACNGNCSGDTADNGIITSDSFYKYTTVTLGNTYANDANFTVKDFPTNNAQFDNKGVENFGSVAVTSTNYPENFASGNFTYVSGATPTTLTTTTISSRTTTPGNLYHFYWDIDRNSPLRFTTGGSVYNNAGRYTLNIDGPSEADDRFMRDIGGRCAILIEE